MFRVRFLGAAGAVAILLIACRAEQGPVPTEPEPPIIPQEPGASPAPEEPPCVGSSCIPGRVVPTAQSTLSDGAAFASGGDWAQNPTGIDGVTLARETVFPPYMWVANHTLGSVSRVNTTTGVEEGRYWVGANPSRTAVDLDGNVWIGARDDGRLTKILWDTTQCLDRNADGVITTASVENLGPLNSVADPLADECIVYSDVPNPTQPSIRGLAAAPDGTMWIGYSYGGVQSIDAHSFALGAYVDRVGAPVYRQDGEGVYRPVINPDGDPITADIGGVYGLVIDREGYLYVSPYASRGNLPRLNTATGQWDALYQNIGCSNYGIAVDGSDRVWLGCTDGCGGAVVFDPSTLSAGRFPVGTSGIDGRPTRLPAVADASCGYGWGVTGLAAEPETGDIWVSFYQAGYTGRLRVEGVEPSERVWELIPTAPGTGLWGIGFDYQGFAWTHGANSALVWKLDPNTMAHADGYEEGVEIGGPHYTYSDFTGSTGLSFTAPRGTWVAHIENPDGPTRLAGLEVEAFVPDGATVEVRVRPIGEGGPGAWVPSVTEVGAPVFLHLSQAAAGFSALEAADRYEVEVRLSATGRSRPVVHGVAPVWLGADG